MKIFPKFVLLAIFASTLIAGPLDQVLEVKDAARAWVVKDGIPLYYTSSSSQYMIVNQIDRRMPGFPPEAVISLSPHADYRLISSLKSLGEVKDGQRYADYFVLNANNDLQFAVNRGTSADLKPLVAAVSDEGILALANPVKAFIYFYEQGELISEGQLYEDDGQRSLERNIRMQWVGDKCYILLERPGFNGGPAGRSLFISINADGRGQQTSYLPFTYLQDFAFQNGRFFVSGYDYNAADNEYKPMIIEISAQGKVLWNNENFGHELQVSANGDYLAVLSDHEFIQLFDLGTQRVEQIRFDHNDKVCLGLSVNNRGKVALIRVAADFFAKRNTHHSQIFFPQESKNVNIQIDPRHHRLFQVQSDGYGFFIGTNYEWLEIRP